MIYSDRTFYVNPSNYACILTPAGYVSTLEDNALKSDKLKQIIDEPPYGYAIDPNSEIYAIN